MQFDELFHDIVKVGKALLGNDIRMCVVAVNFGTFADVCLRLEKIEETTVNEPEPKNRGIYVGRDKELRK